MTMLAYLLAFAVFAALGILALVLIIRADDARLDRQPSPLTVTPASHAPVWMPQEGFTTPAQDPTKGLHGEYLWNEDMYTR